jgi:hypothetical protein
MNRTFSYVLPFLLVILSANCRADNTVPWLTGLFSGGNQTTYETGTGTTIGIGGFYLPNPPLTFMSSQFLVTSTDFVETPLCLDGVCGGYSFIGDISGGTLLMNVLNLDFSGAIMQGGFGGYYCWDADVCGDTYYVEDTGFSFRGVWSNGWHTDGELFVFACSDLSCQQGINGYVIMTTATPEPSSMILLSSGVLGLVARRKFKQAL